MHLTLEKKIAIVTLFGICICPAASFAQMTQIISGAQIERARDILEKEEAWKWKINRPEKVLIKNIEVKEVMLLGDNLIKEIIAPYKNRWLCENEIQGIISAVRILYEKNGYPNEPKEISFEIEKHNLKIKVQESRFKGNANEKKN